MRRWLSGLLALLLICAVAEPGVAHVQSLTASVSVTGDEVSVELLDPYENPVEAAVVTAGVAIPGEKGGDPAPLVEVSPGVYRGQLNRSAEKSHQVQVRVVTVSEEFWLPIDLKAGQDLTENMFEMAPIEPRQIPWGTIFYGLTVAVLVLAGTVAVLRRPIS